jgi:hypothetical protein
VRPSTVIFTSGGTESDNLAVKGLFWKRREQITGIPVVVASPIEHHAVLDPLNWLAEHEGAEISWLPVDAVGRVSAADVVSAIAAAEGRAALVTVMWANNEIGTVQPVHEIAEVCRAAGVPFHTDAVQALGALPLDLTGIDAVTYAIEAARLGAGEILLTSMDRDGTRIGYDLALTRAIADAVPVPVVASGGVGSVADLVSGVVDGHASAVLAASIFHFGQASVADAKAAMAAAGIAVRR